MRSLSGEGIMIYPDGRRYEGVSKKMNIMALVLWNIQVEMYMEKEVNINETGKIARDMLRVL